MSDEMSQLPPKPEGATRSSRARRKWRAKRKKGKKNKGVRKENKENKNASAVTGCIESALLSHASLDLVTRTDFKDLQCSQQALISYTSSSLTSRTVAIGSFEFKTHRGILTS